MKHIYILLLLVGINLVSAQDLRFFENTWYLTKIVSNGIDYFPPTSTEVSLINLNFNQQENTFNTNYCNTIYGGVVFGNNLTDFSLNTYAVTLRLCNSQSVNSYENFYINFFIGNSPNNNFSYTIQENGTEKILTINSVSNVKALYSSKNLSTIDFKSLDFKAYYELSTASLVLELDNQNAKIAIAEVFDSLGKKILSKTFYTSQTKINIENLPSGICFIKIATDNQVGVKKVVIP
ncbi:MAG: T9SS type A sorting domain-containing protein [Flavobacterium sp.]|nr:T9SS type A sorting domain-containing protein [Flavobacterium sp.]